MPNMDNVSWKLTSVVSSVVLVVVVAMWNIFAAIGAYTTAQDEADQALSNRIAAVEGETIGTEELVVYENRITSAEKDIEWLLKDHHKEGKLK